MHITLWKTVGTCGFLVVLKQLKKQAELLKDGQNAIRKTAAYLKIATSKDTRATTTEAIETRRENQVSFLASSTYPLNASF